MTQNKLIERLTENWPAKVFSLCIAVLLYFTYQSMQLETRYFSIPITVIANKNIVSASVCDKTVRIAVKTRSDVIETLQKSDFRAYLDLNHYNKEGTYDIPIKLELSPAVQVIDSLEIEARPKFVNLVLEEKITKKVPIVPSFTGDPSSGYEITGATVQPQEITVTGPKSAVEGWLDQIIIQIPIENKDTSFVQSTEIVPLVDNPLLDVIDATDAYFSVHIEPCQIARTFTNVKVQFTSLNPYFQVTQKTPLSLTLSGAQNVLQKYTLPQNTVQVNCSSIDSVGEYTLPLSLNINDNFMLVSSSADAITVVADPAPVVLP